MTHASFPAVLAMIAACGLLCASPLVAQEAPRTPAGSEMKVPGDEQVAALAEGLALLAPAKAPAAPLALGAENAILFIGDSITNRGGYLRQIGHVLARRYPAGRAPQVIKSGRDSSATEHLLARFDKDAVAPRPQVIAISVGVNDVGRRLGQAHEERFLAAYRKDLVAMVDKAQAANIAVLLLAPTILTEDPQSEGNRRLPMYVEAMRQIAADKNCSFADLHALFLEALRRKPAQMQGDWLTVDGVHMKPLGDALMAVGVLRALGVPDEAIREAASDPAGAVRR